MHPSAAPSSMGAATLLLLALVAVAIHTARPQTITGPQRGFVGRAGLPLCDEEVWVATPSTTAEIQQLVRNSSWTYIKAIAAGISFAPWACPAKVAPGSSQRRLLIQMTRIRSHMELNKQASTVSVDTGFLVGELSIYLQQQGYSLATYGLFVNGTIGGSFLTGVHGSSTRSGTTSSSIVRATVVLGNGTVTEVDESTRISLSQGSRQRLLPILRMSFGRLGVVTRLTIKVIKDYPVFRKVTQLPVSSLPSTLNRLYRKGRENESEGSMLFWYPAIDTLNFHSYERRDDLASQTTASPAIFTPSNFITPGVEFVPTFDAALFANPNLTAEVLLKDPVLVQRWMDDYFYRSPWEVNRAVWHSVGMGETFFLNWFAFALVRSGGGRLGYQFEVAVDLENAGACFARLRDGFNRKPSLRDVFRAPFIIRPVNGEADRDVLLSPTLGKKAVYFRIDHATRDYPPPYRREDEYKELESILLSKPCNGRVHWALFADWQKYAPLAKRQYGQRLQLFGQAVDRLDPAGRFTTELDELFF